MTEMRLERSIHLRFHGDWGQANMHRVCGWLSQEVVFRTGPDTRCWIGNGRGGADAARAVWRAQADVAVMTPAWLARLALRGCGPFEDEPMPGLRALGVLPQWDRLILAVRRGAASSNLRDTAGGLRLTTSPNDGVNLIGWCASALTRAAGLDFGALLTHETPVGCLADIAAGRADAIIHEAVMLPAWQELAPSLEFVDVPDDLVVELSARAGADVGATVPAGYFPSLDRDLAALDFADFVLLVRDDLSCDVGELIARCLIETRENIERQYRHLPPERSPLGYPIEPGSVADTPIPLHDGAALAYRELGLR